MKREDKNQLTYKKIFDGALIEFANNGYESSSVNNICSAQNISKGIVYHYFKSKDDLFITCINQCFDLLTSYIISNLDSSIDDVKSQLENYFSLRLKFFKENPMYQKIFCEAVINPPAHLIDEINKGKGKFDLLNKKIISNILLKLPINDEFSIEDIVEILKNFQDFINSRYHYSDGKSIDFEKRESECLKTLNVILYGIIDRGVENE